MLNNKKNNSTLCGIIYETFYEKYGSVMKAL